MKLLAVETRSEETAIYAAWGTSKRYITINKTFFYRNKILLLLML
jgi:hypothetical protein